MTRLLSKSGLGIIAAVALSAAAPAKADVVAYSSFSISNAGLYYTNSVGGLTQLPASNSGFGVNTGSITNNAVNVALAGTLNDYKSGIGGGTGNLNIDPQMAVIGSGAFGQNNFGRASVTPGNEFTRADSRLTGSLASFPNSNFLASQTVAETRLTGDNNTAASASTGSSGGISFNFTLNGDTYNNLTLQLDAVLSLYVAITGEPDSQNNATASANLVLRLTKANDTTVVRELNINDILGGTSIPTVNASLNGTSDSLDLSTPGRIALGLGTLAPGSWTLSIVQTASVSAGSTTVPEPGVPALLGTSILLVGALLRLRRREEGGLGA
ncbi:EDSAP-1 family PEP-CTERM protein [Rhodospirillum rubrum]|uniref:PEP-CTERM protein-sorting domain-containing protein n=1 Tax=Rhodospirillum rubrum (strain ATCC 11170 / ATH 1.1.1 / DSM 467 / LMG 4362 / NCIMB 8255 / S1) TaxID=269796 RepID=Q2RPQ5_RHORT|nr:EDSAP-1 family PEP-CTERM protein [Rhodospirillum rubrum]ABC23890.1 hypothetical protein Rru_A3095 [Rhodospirillum rubrum ATCC 11170]AEO49634.1 hypothetical protein F11_15860 [Rhodospirillum rubrum F11]MBK5955566.1 hypothetical protein [Rhodospirillum rubrum]QXG79836.1 hypothetical protein KUL73_15960 [Rhodospirillum rubrum]HAP99165.1 hypothetical protein [Rhodospirillum rubrum]